MNWLKRKWQKWRDARNAELRRRGYDYAAGQLLIHKGSQEAIQRLESESSGTFDFNDFDQGIWDAQFDWTRLHPEVTTQTLSEIRKLQDWADANALGRASTAAREGLDLAAIEEEIKADSRRRNPAEQQLDAEWREAQDATVTQSLVDLANASLADRAPRDPDYYGHPECNRVTNSPCDWSNSGPLADTCKVCSKDFPTWN